MINEDRPCASTTYWEHSAPLISIADDALNEGKCYWSFRNVCPSCYITDLVIFAAHVQNLRNWRRAGFSRTHGPRFSVIFVKVRFVSTCLHWKNRLHKAAEIPAWSCCGLTFISLNFLVSRDLGKWSDWSKTPSSLLVGQWGIFLGMIGGELRINRGQAVINKKVEPRWRCWYILCSKQGDL